MHTLKLPASSCSVIGCPAAARWRCGVPWLTAVLLALGFGSHCLADPVSFRNEVMAVLSQAGCNRAPATATRTARTASSSPSAAKTPTLDLAVLTRDSSPAAPTASSPADSLILLKPTGVVAHEGGKRFDVGSREYGILRRWIAAGCPRRPARTLPCSRRST